MKKIFTLPKKSKTLTDKIRKSNPWSQGDSLADAVEKAWPEIQRIHALHNRLRYAYSDLREIPAIKEWSEKHYLNNHHVMYSIVEEYL